MLVIKNNIILGKKSPQNIKLRTLFPVLGRQKIGTVLPTFLFLETFFPATHLHRFVVSYA